MVYSEFFRNDLSLFNKVEYCEYLLKMICWFVFPIATVLIIIKKEFKYSSEQHLKAQENDFSQKEKSIKSEFIKGLRYNSNL